LNNQLNSIGFKEALDILNRNKGLLLSVFMVACLSGILFFEFSPKKYRVATKLLIYQNSKNKSLSGQWMADLHDFDNSNFVSNEMEILKSTQLRKLAFHSADGISKITSYNFLENMAVASLKNTDIIELNLTTDQPHKGIFLLTELLCFYQEISAQKIKSSDKKTLFFLDARVRELKFQVEDVENQLTAFKEKYNLSLPLETFAFNLNKNLENQYSQQLSLNERRNEKANLFSELNKLEFLFLPNQVLGDLIGLYNSKKIELEFQKEITEKNHPEIIKHEALLNTIISDLKSKIIDDIAYLDSLLIKQQIDGYELKNQWNLIPKLDADIKRIMRDKEILDGLFRFLTQKKEETEMNLASQPDLFWNFDPPATLYLHSPNPFKILAIVLFMGVFIPCSVILAKNSFDTTIYSITQLKKIANIPILGTIEQAKTDQKIVFDNDKHQGISEQIRLIRTSLQFILPPQNNAQVILITSCISGEGKTFFSANFGASMAALGKKTVIIGFDLRSPKLNSYLGGNDQQKGISHYLSNQCSEIDLIQHSPFHHNLSFILAGPIPPNPVELMNPSKLDRLFAFLKKQFDFILLDSPPIQLVTDAFLLADYVDCTLFMIRLKKTETQHIHVLNEISLQKKLPLPTIVLNGYANRGQRYEQYYPKKYSS
jgi:tyrosine-protein kinase Etk/Wzc